MILSSARFRVPSVLHQSPKRFQRPRSSSGVVTTNGTQKLKAPARKQQKGTQRLQPKKSGTQQKKATSSPSLGTIVKRKAKQVTEIAQSKGASFQPRGQAKSAPLLLARIQQLRLLTKLEQAGLLTLLEKNGITLTFIEKSGLLSKAESFGLLSAAADRNTPKLLFRLALALYAVGPLVVYAVPDNSTPLIALQAIVALASLVGGTAAFGGASLLNSLQTDRVA